jgi:hypothetical protein
MGVQVLLIVAIEPSDAAAQRGICEELEKFIASHRWLSSRPEIITVDDEAEQEDGAIKIGSLIGVRMVLPAARLSTRADLDAESAALRDVEAIIAHAAKLSRSHRAQWEVDLDERGIGSIVDGLASRSILVGLIGAWRDHLDAQGHVDGKS